MQCRLGLLLLLLLLTAEWVIVVLLWLAVRVVRLKRRLLGLDRVLLWQERLSAKLIKACGLAGKTVRISILIPSLLRLRILAVQKAGILGLLWERVAEPVDSWLLLIALVVPCRLRLSRCWGIVEQRCCILILELSSSERFLLLAQPDGFGQIIVVVTSCSLVVVSSSSVLLGFVFACLKGQAHLGIVFIASCLSAGRSWLGWTCNSLRGIFINTSHASLPKFSVRSFAAQSFFVENKGRELFSRDSDWCLVSNRPL